MATMTYKDAMEQLQGMFPDFDRETLKAVLVANEGHFERTVEDCLKMANEAEGGSHENNDNLFSNTGGSKNTGNNRNRMYDASEGLFDDNNDGNNPEGKSDENDFGDEEYKSQQMAKKLQENEDAKLAYALQQEYVRRSQAEESGGHRSQQRNRNSTNEQVVYPGMNNYANSNQVYRPEEQKYNGGYGNGTNMNNGMNNNNAVLPGEKKKKKGFGSKIKSAFSGLFGKKGKKKNAPTTNPGEYAEIGGPDDEAAAYRRSDDDQREALEFDQLDADEESEGNNEKPIQLSDILNGGGNNRKFGDEDHPQAYYPKLDDNENNQRRMPNYSYNN